MSRDFDLVEKARGILSAHGLVVLKELLETLTQEGRHEQSF